MSYEASLKQHYQSVSQRLRWAPALRIAPPREVEQLPPPVVVATPEIDPPPPLTRRQIVAEVCAKHGITVLQIIEHTRDADIVNARQEAMYRLRHERAMTYPEIGRYLGGFDYSTARHSCLMHADKINGTDTRQPKRSTIWTDDRKRTALEMRNAGWTNTEIAAAIGLDRRRVADVVPRLVREVRGMTSKERLRRYAAEAQA